jgi:predicted flap endonuclease-1-like 5' DNA nuclease
MNKNSGSISCAAGCWGVALLVGILAMALLMVLGGWSFMQAVFGGGVIFVVSGAVISWLICKPLPAPGAATIDAGAPAKPAPAKPAPAKPAPAKPATAKPAAKAGKPAAAAAPAVKSSSQLPGETELDQRKGTWRYGEEKAPAKAAAAPAAAATAEDAPETLSAARAGGADNLKLLKGVGPKLEQTLNELGFYHFDQIAAWTDAQVAWVDSRLRFKGRIERDGWIEQAKILASGGETEFSKRNK